MTWRPVDCHAHTTMSDGSVDVATLVGQAMMRGIRPSVSDHISRDAEYYIRDLDGVRAYLDVLDQYPVLRAGEFCWHDGLWREIPADVVARFNHRIGSLHAIYLADGTLVHAFGRTLPVGLTADAYMDAHVDQVERFAAEMPVDILAHPTLVPIPLRSMPLEDLWIESREERLVSALGAAGIAFEVSGRYRPHERLVRRAAAAGVRLSLGSDGHSVDQVANIEFSLAVTRAAGVRDEELYDPIAHGSRTDSAGAR